MNNLQDDGWDLKDLKYIQLSDKETELYSLDYGDILFNRTNSKELVGKCGVFKESGLWLFASYLIRVKLNQSKAIPDFISTFIYTKAGRLQIDRVSRQIIGMTNINAEEIKDLLIPLPPIEIQKSLVAEIEIARQNRKQKIAQAEELLSSIDSYLLSELGLTPPETNNQKTYAISFKEVKLNQRIDADYFHPERILAIKKQKQITKLNSQRLIDVADFIKKKVATTTSENYVGLANIQKHTGEIIELNDKNDKGQSYIFIEKDILFARLRPYLNKVYRAEKDGVCSTEFHVIRIKESYRESVLPDYLATMLRSSLILAQTRHMMTGNTHPRLTDDDVINLVVPIPDIKIQKELVIKLRNRRIEARKLRQEAELEWETAKSRFENKLLGEET